MDPLAPQKVLTGIAITSSLCSVAAGLYGGFRHGAPGKFILYSAVNSGIVAATFFSVREYVVSPILVVALPGRQHELRRQKPPHTVDNGEQPSLSWTDIRTFHLLDSGISGGLAGGVLNAWKRGRRGLVPGLTTGALLCTAIQWCFNESNILRIRYISANMNTLSRHTIHGSVDPEQKSSMALPISTSTSAKSPTLHSPLDRILFTFGQRVSDEKYLERLKTERDMYLRRIAQLEEEKKQ